MKRLKENWRVYLMEAVCLGLFMVSASFFAALLESRSSWVHRSISNDFVRLVLMGVAMGTTATLLIYSPMGKISGAHMNPAVSFTFVRLGKMNFQDAMYYALFQCAGGLLAICLMAFLLGDGFTASPVSYVVTVPGRWGAGVAFAAEWVIAFVMMSTVLILSNQPKWARYTGAVAGVLVTIYVIVTGPISGFSMNPARTLASAVPAGRYDSFWIYITAPFLGMWMAAESYRFFHGAVMCAKLHHAKYYQCIFNCGYCEHAKRNTQD